MGISDGQGWDTMVWIYEQRDAFAAKRICAGEERRGRGMAEHMVDATLGPLPEIGRVEQVCDGWLKKYRLHANLPDGKGMIYDVVSRKDASSYESVVRAQGKVADADAVCIVPFTKDGSLLLIREFRFPVNSPCIAFPAGLKESGEDVVECASRELREETGYDIMRNPDGTALNVHCCRVPGYSSLGMSDESIGMVFAQVEKVGEAHTEPTEFIEHFELPRSEIGRFLEECSEPLSIRCQLVLEMLAFDPLAVR